MAKTRLTNADREAIRDAVLDHKFTPLQAALNAEQYALALQARAKAYGDYLATIDAAPEGAFGGNSNVRLNIGGKRIRLRFGADRVSVRLFNDHMRYGGNDILTLTDSDTFGKKVMAWAEREEALKVEQRNLRDSVGGTLQAFKTFDDLQAGWPEADKFITARWRERPEYVANVPVVALRDLSTALDLPPEVAEAA